MFFCLEFYFHPYGFNFNFSFVLLIHTCCTSFLPVFVLTIIILNSLPGSSNNWAISKSRSVFSIVLVHIEIQAMFKSLGLFPLMVVVTKESGPRLVPFHFSPVRGTLHLLLSAAVGLDTLIWVQPMCFPFRGSLKLLSRKSNNPGGLFTELYAFPEVMTTPPPPSHLAPLTKALSSTHTTYSLSLGHSLMFCGEEPIIGLKTIVYRSKGLYTVTLIHTQLLTIHYQYIL